MSIKMLTKVVFNLNFNRWKLNFNMKRSNTRTQLPILVLKSNLGLSLLKMATFIVIWKRHYLVRLNNNIAKLKVAKVGHQDINFYLT